MTVFCANNSSVPGASGGGGGEGLLPIVAFTRHRIITPPQSGISRLACLRQKKQRSDGNKGEC